MSRNVGIYNKLESDNREITLADKSGKKIASNGMGEIVVEQKNIEIRIRLSNVPDFNSNLLTVAKITDHGYRVEFKSDDRNQIKVRAVKKGNAYYVKTNIVNSEKAKVVQDSEMWHRRLGHVNKDLIKEMKEKDLVLGIDGYKQCKACIEGKACQKTHHRLKRRAEKIMDLWHVDLVEPVRPATKEGKNYILTVIDDYS